MLVLLGVAVGVEGWGVRVGVSVGVSEYVHVCGWVGVRVCVNLCGCVYEQVINHSYTQSLCLNARVRNFFLQIPGSEVTRSACIHLRACLRTLCLHLRILCLQIPGSEVTRLAASTDAAAVGTLGGLVTLYR